MNPWVASRLGSPNFHHFLHLLYYLNMTLQKELIENVEVIYSPKADTYKKFLICVPGGGKNIGASRFDELQKRLYEKGIGSLSINFQGVEGSAGSIELDTLENRINVVNKIIDWVKHNFNFEELSLYGISMGGYVVLGVQNMQNCNGKIIIHTPAAYAKESLQLNLNEQFTNILRTPNSWKNSESFDWLQKINSPTLLIIHNEDEVIPKEISNTYKDIILKKENSKTVEIAEAKHSIWNSDDINKEFKEKIILEIIFILKTCDKLFL
jgi:uncharacterized protein